MVTQEKLAGRCGRCGAKIYSEQRYCAQCSIEMAEKNISGPELEVPVADGSPERKRAIWKIVHIFIIILCLTIIAFQVKKIIGRRDSYRPIRQGSWETDKVTDACIKNLWQISRILQDGKLPGKDIVCPGSGKPYIITGTGRSTAARCPNPELHGFKDVSVDRNSPRPKVKS